MAKVVKKVFRSEIFPIRFTDLNLVYIALNFDLKRGIGYMLFQWIKHVNLKETNKLVSNKNVGGNSFKNILLGLGVFPQKKYIYFAK